MRLDGLDIREGIGDVVVVSSTAPVRCGCGDRRPAVPVLERRYDVLRPTARIIRIAPRRCGRCGGRINAVAALVPPGSSADDLLLAIYRVESGVSGDFEVVLPDDGVVEHSAVL